MDEALSMLMCRAQAAEAVRLARETGELKLFSEPRVAKELRGRGVSSGGEGFWN